LCFFAQQPQPQVQFDFSAAASQLCDRNMKRQPLRPTPCELPVLRP
jgi:hypothetical protein